MKDDLLKKYIEDEVYNILVIHLKMDVLRSDLSDVKLIFMKLYSPKAVERVRTLISKRLFASLSFFSNDSINDYDEETDELYSVDYLYLYSLKINKEKYYLCFSLVHDEKAEGLKIEKVEAFAKA